MSKMLTMLDPFDEIKRLYFSTTKQTIERDLARAMELLTHLPSDEARQRVAGYMHGLSDLKREWKPAKKAARTPQPRRHDATRPPRTTTQGPKPRRKPPS